MPYRVSMKTASDTILAGGSLDWDNHQKYKKGSVVLENANARRVFQFLLDQSTYSTTDDELLSALIVEWDKDADPAENIVQGGASASSTDTWYLSKIITRGFGGINTFQGPIFSFDVDGSTWCLEGQNGSGKTSMICAVLWAITGHTISEHEGITDTLSHPQPVRDQEGNEIGSWPPIAAYPFSKAEIVGEPEVAVCLTFRNQSGDHAKVYRYLKYTILGERVDRIRIDPRLANLMDLFEVGVIMPNKINSMGFDGDSGTIYEAVKRLTGLDKLSDIGTFIKGIKRSNSRFLKYAKDKGIDNIEEEYRKWLKIAYDKAKEANLRVADFGELDEAGLVQQFLSLASDAEAKAADCSASLTEQTSEELNPATFDDRNRIKAAVEKARSEITDAPTKYSMTMVNLKTLSDAAKKNQLDGIQPFIKRAIDELKVALYWHGKQQDDIKLRLKATACDHLDDGFVDDPNCPLCESDLKGKEHQTLINELQEIQEQKDQAQKALTDVCNKINADAKKLLSNPIWGAYASLSDATIKSAFIAEITKSFVEADHYRSILTGIGSLVESSLQANEGEIEDFTSVAHALPEVEVSHAKSVVDTLSDLYRLKDIAEWWLDNRPAYWEFWKKIVGHPLSEGETAPDSIMGNALEKLYTSIQTATPYDELSNASKNAANSVQQWQMIQKAQAKRQTIIDEIETLGDLVEFSNAETARTFDRLSDRIGSIISKIHLNERLAYQDAKIKKQGTKNTVSIDGGISSNGNDPEYAINATYIANTSWLKAILWAFIFSLREETINQIGHNSLPLLVLDDPQNTFDPGNLDMWSVELEELANNGGDYSAQLLLTTHDTHFFKELVNTYHVSEEYGRISSANIETGVMIIEQGTHLDRTFNRANDLNNDEIARKFISDLRIYIESSIRYLLYGQGKTVQEENLSPLIVRLKTLIDGGTLPFDRNAFKALHEILEKNNSEVSLLQREHHHASGSVALAIRIKSKLFTSRFKTILGECFYLMSDWRSHKGEPRAFAQAENVITFPNSMAPQIRQIELKSTGQLAAASTDGRGVLGLNDFSEVAVKKLVNHEFCHLATNAIEACAAFGDYIVVSNFESPQENDIILKQHAEKLIVRKYLKSDTHEHLAVLTPNTNDPHSSINPLLTSSDMTGCKKVVGVIFNDTGDFPNEETHDVLLLNDISMIETKLTRSSLYQVQGDSAVPIALNDQFLIVDDTHFDLTTSPLPDGTLVLAVTNSGDVYFKRYFSHNGNIIMLESINKNGNHPSIPSSLDGSVGEHLQSVRKVHGVLYEEPR